MIKRMWHNLLCRFGYHEIGIMFTKQEGMCKHCYAHLVQRHDLKWVATGSDTEQ